MRTVKKLSEYLVHHGIKGQRWGERRFQNEDGTLTEEGKRRYYESLTSDQKKIFDEIGTNGQRVLLKKVQEGKSFVEAHKAAQASNARLAAGLLLGIPLIYAGVYTGTYFGTMGLIKGAGKLAAKALNSNTYAKIRQHGSQFMKRHAAKKAGAIVLGKKNYSVVNADPVKSIFGLIKR